MVHYSSGNRPQSQMIGPVILILCSLLAGLSLVYGQQPGCGLDCHVCSAPFAASGSFECTKCRNQAYLYEGACYQNCSVSMFPGYEEVGQGFYSRRCIPRCDEGSFDSSPVAESATCVDVTPCTGTK